MTTIGGRRRLHIEVEARLAPVVKTMPLLLSAVCYLVSGSGVGAACLTLDCEKRSGATPANRARSSWVMRR